jgi:predicted RNA-binding protein (TIGR00451 family)
LRKSAGLDDLATIYSILNYQYGEGVGEIILETKDISITRYKSGFPRQLYLNGKIFGTFNPRTGFISLSQEGAKIVFGRVSGKRIVVNRDQFLIHARNTVLAPIVVDASSDIRAGDEVFIVDEDDALLATGKALLSSPEIMRVRYGEVARLRRKISNGSG